MKNWLTGKYPDGGKDWRGEEKGMTEDKMVGWYHWLNRHEFVQTLGDGEGQGNLVSCSPWTGLNWATEQQPSLRKLITLLENSFSWKSFLHKNQTQCLHLCNASHVLLLRSRNFIIFLAKQRGNLMQVYCYKPWDIYFLFQNKNITNGWIIIL